MYRVGFFVSLTQIRNRHWSNYINGWRSKNYIIMKVFKNKTFKDIDFDEVEIGLGESIVCRHKKIPQNFTVHIQRLHGVFTPTGVFTDLSTAIKYAERLENPSIMKNGYQIIELDHSQKLIIYYGMYEPEIVDYIKNTNHDRTETIKIADSGLVATFINSIDSEIININKDIERHDLALFGQYMMSEERRKRFASHPEFGDTHLDQRLAVVHDSDFDWFEQYKNKFEGRGSTILDDSIDREAEMKVITDMKDMCKASLSPDTFTKFEEVVIELVENRKGLRGA